MTTNNLGILGIGTYLPPDVRKNDWWPESVVRTWMDKRAANRQRFKDAPPPSSDGVARALQIMEEAHDDPFQGAVERRVLPDGMHSSDMELRAAEEAIARAGIDRREIGAILGYSAVPDYLVTNNACLLHERLGLRADCFTTTVDAACNSFISQLTLAQSIVGRDRKYALLVQSCGISRLLEAAEPISPWFGDGATAVVVGPVAEGRGLLGTAHRTDGSLHLGLVAGVRKRRWYEDGHVELYSAEPSLARKTFLELLDRGKDVVDDVLAKTGVSADAVDFYGVHQGTPWARTATRDYFGLRNAQSVETFRFAASIFAGNIPLAMALGEREGMLRDGATVVMFAGGAGLTYSSAVLRWGR